MSVREWVAGCRPCGPRMRVLVPLAALLAVLVLMLFPVGTGFCTADVAVPVAGGLLAVAGLPLFIAGGCRMRLTAIDGLLGMWLLYVLLRAWCGTPEVPCLPAVLRSVSLAALYAALRLLFSYAVPSVTATEGVVALFAVVQCLLCLSQLLCGGSRHADFPFTGTFPNPGPCSAVFLVGLCLGFYRFFYPVSPGHARLSGACRALFMSTLALCSLMLPLGWSRAALTGAVVCLLVATWPRMTSRMRLSVLGMAVVAGLLLYFMKRGSSEGRVLFYAVSSYLVARHPVFGSGIGTFFGTYGQGVAALHQHLPFALTCHAGTIEYALCDGMRVAVEQGLVGLLLAVSSASAVLWRLWRCSPALALALLGVLVVSLFSYPFQLLPFQLLLVLLSAQAASTAVAPAPRDLPAGSRGGVGLAFSMAVFAVLSAFLVFGPVRERVRATAQSRLIVGRDSPRLLPQYESLLPFMRHDAQFLFRYGQMLASCGRYNESNHLLAQGALVSNAPMLHVLRGHNYRHLHAPAHADRAYRQAHAQSPARLYPLLCLMRLYRQSGQVARARRVARVILSLPARSDSPLDMEIRREAKSCIREQ